MYKCKLDHNVGFYFSKTLFEQLWHCIYVQEIVKLCIKTVATMNPSYDSRRETLI